MLLDTAVQLPDSMGERLLYGLQVALTGMLIVFGVLLLIMGVIYLFRLFFYTIPTRRKARTPKRLPAEPPVRIPAPVPVPAAPSVKQDGDEEIAVIAAALAAALDQTPEVFASRYRIRSFKRIL